MPQSDYVAGLRNRFSSMENLELKEAIIFECMEFVAANPHDKEVKQRLSSDDYSTFWQKLSEILVAFQLRKSGLDLSHPKHGPDFNFGHTNRKIHIELITPKPIGLPLGWTNHVSGTAISFPHEEILLRWTSAIKEKSEKLLGIKGKNERGYLDKDIVAPNDIYVIAVNARLLRGFSGMFSDLNGISQFPFAVEAVFCIGPLQVKIDRKTLEVVGSDYEYMAKIKRPSRADVPADTFFDPNFAPVSAIWALDIDESVLVGRPGPMAVVHNPHALNPLPKNILPAQVEYHAQEFEDAYKLMSSPGIWSEDRGLVSVEI